MARYFRRPAVGAALSWVLAAGYAIILGLNLPGHLSSDSVVQLVEGRSGVFSSFGPRVVSFLLGAFDRLSPGTGLFVAMNVLLLFGALGLMPRLRPRTSWAAVVVAVLLLSTPQLLIYQAIVWKDVLFANLTVAGFVCLAFAAKWWQATDRRLPALMGGILLFALASQARQNGLILLVAAALATAVVAAGESWQRRLAWAGIVLIAPLVVGGLLTLAIEKTHHVNQSAFNKGIRLLQQYDVVGTAAKDPQAVFAELEAKDSGISAFIHAEGVSQYTPQRIDTINHGAVFRRLDQIDSATMTATWKGLIIRHTAPYLTHRWDVFSWTFFTPRLDRCLPIHVGIAGPADKLAMLGLTQTQSPRDAKLARYALQFAGTPVYSHAFQALIAVAVAGTLLLRRDPADWVMAGLMVGGIGFAASFFLISIACDYRYLYVLDLAAMTGLFYLSLDAPVVAIRRLWGR